MAEGAGGAGGAKREFRLYQGAWRSPTLNKMDGSFLAVFFLVAAQVTLDKEREAKAKKLRRAKYESRSKQPKPVRRF